MSPFTYIGQQPGCGGDPFYELWRLNVPFDTKDDRGVLPAGKVVSRQTIEAAGVKLEARPLQIDTATLEGDGSVRWSKTTL